MVFFGDEFCGFGIGVKAEFILKLIEGEADLSGMADGLGLISLFLLAHDQGSGETCHHSDHANGQSQISGDESGESHAVAADASSGFFDLFTRDVAADDGGDGSDQAEKARNT